VPAKQSSQPPFGLEGIDHIPLLVDGMAKARRFYETVLGCSFEEALPQYGMAVLRAGAALISPADISVEEGMWALPEVAGGRNLEHFWPALGPHDEKALRRHLAEHRIEIIEESIHADARGESLSLHVRDPSGNVIELKGPPPEAALSTAQKISMEERKSETLIEGARYHPAGHRRGRRAFFPAMRRSIGYGRTFSSMANSQAIPYGHQRIEIQWSLLPNAAFSPK
jgi:glyoxylase I family protein